MQEVKSSPDDCYRLGCNLLEKIGQKVIIYGPLYQAGIEGRFFVDGDMNKGGLDFYIEYLNGSFLRIGFGDSDYNKDAKMGEKLAALSTFYQIMSEDFGSPSFFYTTKDDDKHFINMHWSFYNKEESIKDLLNDDNIDSYIVFDKVDPKPNITKRMKLPSGLVKLVDENIEDYLKYGSNGEVSMFEDTHGYVKKIGKKSK